MLWSQVSVIGINKLLTATLAHTKFGECAYTLTCQPHSTNAPSEDI